MCFEKISENLESPVLAPHLPQGTCPAQSNAPGGALQQCLPCVVFQFQDIVRFVYKTWPWRKEHPHVVISIGQRCFWMWQNCSTFGPMPEPMRLASIRAAVHPNAISTMRTNSSSGRSARGHGCCQNWKRHVTGCHDPQILALHIGLYR